MVKKKDIQPLGLVYSLTGFSFFPFFPFLSSVVANPYSDVLRSLVLPLNGLPILGRSNPNPTSEELTLFSF